MSAAEPGLPRELEVELRYFESKKDELLRHHEGKFALVVGEELLGVFDGREEAYKAGLERRGNVPMLIKQVSSEEPTETLPALTLGLLRADL